MRLRDVAFGDERGLTASGMCFVAGDGSVDQHQVGLRSVAAGRATKNKEKHQTGGGGVTGF